MDEFSSQPPICWFAARFANLGAGCGLLEEGWVSWETFKNKVGEPVAMALLKAKAIPDRRHEKLPEKA